MKALKWLVIVICCACPPCLWSGCQVESTEDNYWTDSCADGEEIERGCEAVYETILAEWNYCKKTNDMPDGSIDITDNALPVILDKCIYNGNNYCVSYKRFDECMDSGIKCVPQYVDIGLSETCMKVLDSERYPE